MGVGNGGGKWEVNGEGVRVAGWGEVVVGVVVRQATVGRDATPGREEADARAAKPPVKDLAAVMSETPTHATFW
jgi:hypothetical protein